MRGKALLVGINKYPGDLKLKCCINDVTDLKKAIETNYDKSANFSVETLTDKKCTRANLRTRLRDLFSGNEEICLFYFSGHGTDDDNDGYIVTCDCKPGDVGVTMGEIITLAKSSSHKFKIIILDCCHSGYAGNLGIIGDTSILPEGTIIMTASDKKQCSFEVGNHGVFTNLLIEAINGGASDILGQVTPGSIYAYIDQALGSWQQRPLFKANISSFVSLRANEPKILISDLKEVMSLFKTEDSKFPLDPSYEKTNFPDSGHRTCKPYANDKNVSLFGKLQKCNRNGLIVPFDCTDMYFAAMDKKSCCLTKLGKHYWKMINQHLI